MADSEQVKALVSPCGCSATDICLILPETFFVFLYLTHLGNFQDRTLENVMHGLHEIMGHEIYGSAAVELNT
jgi:hypothetical protein